MVEDPITPQLNTQESPSADHPRDAATLVIVDRDPAGNPTVLMGRRHPNTVFLPNKYVFPGGRFDPPDAVVEHAHPVSQSNLQNLALSVAQSTTPSQLAGLALTALRETFEETGVVIGKKQNGPGHAPPPPWQRFFDTGYLPDPSGLTYFARAITPPGRPKRYDTRFFCVAAEHISQQISPIDDELSDIGWVSLDKATTKDVASITRLILSDIKCLVSTSAQILKPTTVPFYFYEETGFQRVLLSHQDSIA